MISAEFQAKAARITLRRCSGPTADELFFLCRPGDLSADVSRQAESLYEALAEKLSSEAAEAATVVSETLFFRRIGADLPQVRTARQAVLERAGIEQSYHPATTFIGQPPLSGAGVELAAVAVVPHRRDSWTSTAAAVHRLGCSCAACSRGAHAKLLQIYDETHVYAGSICGSTRGGFEEALQMFRAAEELLKNAGMSFRDVVRTWIYLRDIDRDYADLNRARREFFRQCGIERKPASTGVQGIPPSDAHDFSLSFYARRSSHPGDVRIMSASTLNEAWMYGADFSRGLRVAGAQQRLYVSGTASIGEKGESLHPGALTAQADRMLLNIEALLAAQGATFHDLVSAVTYVKKPTYAPLLQRIFRKRGFDGFPLTIVEAPLCRPELLCETEAIAALPVTGA